MCGGGGGGGGGGGKREGLAFKGSNFLPLRHILCFPSRTLLERAMFSKKGEEPVTKVVFQTFRYQKM